MNFKPHDYQVECMDFIIDNPKSALFLEMGLGKSVIVLKAIEDMMLNSLDIKRTLIVAPLRVASVTWPAEIEKWGFSAGFSYFVLHGKNRRPDIPDVDITLTNYETLVWLVNHRHLISRYDYVVFDESTWLKNESSRRWKLAFSMFGAVDRMTLLTGTPIPNGLMDIWGQMFFIDRGKALGRTKTTYKEQYFVQGGYGFYKWFPRKNALDQVIDKIKDDAKTLKAADYLNMPKLLFNDVPIQLDASVMTKYRELERDFFVELQGVDITAFNSAALSNKLRQFVQGFVYDADKQPLRFHSHKIDALKELVRDSFPSENFLVSINFIYEAQMLKAVFPKAEVVYGATDAKESARIIKEWNKGNVKMLIAHPASLGHGLNLQDGGRMIVWFGPTWNLEHWLQFNKRLHRQGQTKPVIVHTLVAEGTIDKVIATALKGKDTDQEKLLASLIKYQKSLSNNPIVGRGGVIVRKNNRGIPAGPVHKERVAV